MRGLPESFSMGFNFLFSRTLASAIQPYEGVLNLYNSFCRERRNKKQDYDHPSLVSKVDPWTGAVKIHRIMIH